MVISSAHNVMSLSKKTGDTDPRFRALLNRQDWNALPIQVKRRFSKRLSGTTLATYKGIVTELRMSIAGKLLSQVLRLVGAPLPTCADIGVPSLVCVSEDAKSGGQIWTRIYGKSQGFHQVIQSVKQFSGPTGLDEHIGFGISIALKARVENRALVFTSAAYSLGTKAWRFTLPNWLSPGKLRVEHRDLGQGKFRFSLSLIHPLLGEMLYQSGIYRDE